MDSSSTPKEKAVLDLNSQNFTREKFWLTFFHVFDVKTPLRAVFQTNEDKLIKLLGTHEY